MLDLNCLGPKATHLIKHVLAAFFFNSLEPSINKSTVYNISQLCKYIYKGTKITFIFCCLTCLTLLLQEFQTSKHLQLYVLNKSKQKHAKFNKRQRKSIFSG